MSHVIFRHWWIAALVLFMLEGSIVNGDGKIRVDDSTWKVRGQDRHRGSRVRVVGIDGAVLSIESER